jgi:hypothetical protein
MRASTLLPLLVVACGTTPRAAEPSAAPEYFTLWAPGVNETLRLDARRAWGPNSEVELVNASYRGRIRGVTVDLRPEGDRVTGFLGPSPTDLHVGENEGTLVADGLVGGTLSHFEMSEAALWARVGSCAYDLHRTTETNAYRGYIACGGSPRVARVTLPPSFASRPPAERAMFLALFLR